MSYRFITNSDGERRSHPCHDFSVTAGFDAWEMVLADTSKGLLVVGRVPKFYGQDESAIDVFLLAATEAGLMVKPGVGEGNLQVFTVGMPEAFPSGDIEAVNALLATEITRRA